MTTRTAIELDGRNRLSLNGFDLKSRTFFVREEAGGVFVLEPAVVLSAAEAAYLQNTEVREQVEIALATSDEEFQPRRRRNRKSGT